MEFEWVKAKIKEYRAWDLRVGLSHFLELLISSEADAQKIRRWVNNNKRKIGGKLFEADIDPICTALEGELWSLSLQFEQFNSLTNWEKTPNKDRGSHATDVKELACQLADLLEKKPHPYYPPVLYYFDDRPALKLIRAFSKKRGEFILTNTGYDYSPQKDYRIPIKDRYYQRNAPIANWRVDDDGKPEFESPAKNLSHNLDFLVAQSWPALLRNLAEYSENTLSEKKPAARPNVQGAEMRYFAKYLSDHFKDHYQKTPYEVIASCVALKFPESENSATGEDVRKWLGKK